MGSFLKYKSSYHKTVFLRSPRGRSFFEKKEPKKLFIVGSTPHPLSLAARRARRVFYGQRAAALSSLLATHFRKSCSQKNFYNASLKIFLVHDSFASLRPRAPVR
jgi:hypothetical protein